MYAMAFNPNQLGSTSGSSQTPGSVPPVITTQPSNQTITAGANATFQVIANNGSTVDWYFDGSQVGGTRFSDSDVVNGIQVTSTLTISQTTMSDNGKKLVAKVNGVGGFVDSNEVTLTVNP